ncbi:hypothetical protein [Enterobacter kobei]|uniref:hypothetical protein n=1 Tax=Enterobacter kobei TaxID=208224 RepID=UPI00388D82CA
MNIFMVLQDGRRSRILKLLACWGMMKGFTIGMEEDKNGQLQYLRLAARSTF